MENWIDSDALRSSIKAHGDVEESLGTRNMADFQVRMNSYGKNAAGTTKRGSPKFGFQVVTVPSRQIVDRVKVRQLGAAHRKYDT